MGGVKDVKSGDTRTQASVQRKADGLAPLQARTALAPAQARLGGAALADELDDGLADGLPSAQPKTETGLTAPAGGRSVPFGPAPIQGKDLAAAALSGFGAAQAQAEVAAEPVAEPEAEVGQAADLTPAVAEAPPAAPSAPSGGGGGGAPGGGPWQAQGNVSDGASLPTSGGDPLPDAVRSQMEQAFSHDFSRVRTHVDAGVSGMGALALTRGQHVYFAPGKYDPTTKSGLSLLGHELWHVVQQSGGRVRPTRVVDGIPVNDDRGLESEADAMGARAASGGSASAGTAAGGGGGGAQMKVAQAQVAQANGGTAGGLRTLKAALEEKADGGDYKWPVARYKWGQLQYEAQIYPGVAGKMAEYESAVDKKLFVNGPDTDPLRSMREVVWGGGYKFLGQEVPFREVVGEKGLNRTIDMPTVWKREVLDPKAKLAMEQRMATADAARFSGEPAQIEGFQWAAARVSGFLDTKTHLNRSSSGVISGGSGYGWWATVATAGTIEDKVNITKLKEQLTVTSSVFDAGAMRFEISPDDFAKATNAKGESFKLYKPTSFDGMSQGGQYDEGGTDDPMWAATSGGEAWGVTKSANAIKEGLLAAFPIASTTHQVYVPGAVDDKWAWTTPDQTPDTGKSTTAGPTTDYLALFDKKPRGKTNAGIHDHLITNAPAWGEPKTYDEFAALLREAGFKGSDSELGLQWGRFKSHNPQMKFTFDPKAHQDIPVIDVDIATPAFPVTQPGGKVVGAKVKGFVTVIRPKKGKDDPKPFTETEQDYTKKIANSNAMAAGTQVANSRGIERLMPKKDATGPSELVEAFKAEMQDFNKKLEAEVGTHILYGNTAEIIDALEADNKKKGEAPKDATQADPKATTAGEDVSADVDAGKPQGFVAPPGAAAPITFHSKPFKVKNTSFAKDKKGRQMVVKGTVVLKNKSGTDLTEAEVLAVRQTLGRRWTTVMDTKVSQVGTEGALAELDKMAIVVTSLAGVELQAKGLELLNMVPEVLLDKDAEASADGAKKDGLLVDQEKKFGIDYELSSEKTADGEKITMSIKSMVIGDVVLQDLVGTGEWKRDELHSFTGSGKAIIPFRDTYTFEIAFANVVIERGKLKSGTGTFTVPFEIPLGETKNGLNWKIVAGATGSLTMDKGEITEIGAGVSLQGDDDRPFVKIDLAGTMPLGKKADPSKINGSATATLLRDVEVAKGLGPKAAWALALGQQSGLTVSMKKGELESISGNVVATLSDATSAFMTISATGTVYEHGKKPKLSVTEAAATLARDVHVVDAGDYALFFEEGTGAKVTLVENKVQKVSGSIPMRIEDKDGPLVGVKLEGQLEGGQFGGSGDVRLLRNLTLARGQGPESNWDVFVREKATGLTATVAGNQLKTVTGELSVGVKAGEKEWLDVSGKGTYDHANGKVSATGSITVSAQTLLGRVPSDDGDVELYIKTGSTASATVTDSQLVEVDGQKIAFVVKVAGKNRFGGELSGKWTRESGAVTGSGSLEVLNNWDIKIPGGKLTINKGTGGTASVKNSALARLEATKIDVDVEITEAAKPFTVNVSGSGVYNHETGVVEKADGDLKLKSPIQVNDRILVKALSGSGSIVNNELQGLSGDLTVTYSDAQGELLEGTVKGGWDRTTGEVNGEASLTLKRDLQFGVGSDMHVVVFQGSGGKATFAKGQLTALTGQLNATLFRKGAPLASIAIDGTYDVLEQKLVKLTAKVSLDQDFEFLEGKVKVSGVSATLMFVDNALVSAKGTATIAAPVIKVEKATITFGWRNDGIRDYYSFDGTFYWVFFKEKTKEGERSLTGNLHVTYNEDGTFLARAAIDYKMGKGFSAKADLEIDNTLEPVIRELSVGVKTTLMDQKTLFDFNKNLFNLRIPVVIPILTVRMGIDVGAALKMKPLTLGGKFSVYDWKPSDTATIPDFEAELSMPWGLTFTAFVGAYLEAALDVWVAAVGIGVTARLVLEVPVDINPKVTLVGGKDGWGGVFGLDLSIHPSLMLQIIPYLFAEVIFFDDFRSELGQWDIPIADFQGLDWSGEFPFGEKLPSRKPKKEGKKLTEGQEKSKSSTDTSGPKDKGSLKDGPVDPQKRKTEKGTLPGGTEISGDKILGGEQAGGGDAAQKDASDRMKKFDALMKGIKALDDFMDYMGAVWKYLMMGPFGVVMLAWEVIAGDLSFNRLAQIWKDVQGALKVVGDFLGEGEPAWSGKKRLGDWLAGRISTYSLLMEDDDEVRKAVAQGVHKDPKMNADGLRGMLEVLTASTNYAGAEDEHAILEICREAKKRGWLNYVIASSEGTMYAGQDQILWKLEGKNDSDYRAMSQGTVVAGQELSNAIPERVKVRGVPYPAEVLKWAKALPVSDGFAVLDEYDAFDSPKMPKQDRDPAKAKENALRKAKDRARKAPAITQKWMKEAGLSW